MSTILGLDLGEFKSVSCQDHVETKETRHDTFTPIPPFAAAT